MTPRYPRPQLRRSSWTSLDGPWSFAIDRDGVWQSPADARFDRTIEVPYSPETPRSGVGETGFFRACWYRRSVAVSDVGAGERVLLHFGAVDYAARVWVDGALVASHEGGYTPFTVDVTEHVRDGRTHELTVRAEDDAADLAKPRGKQDWQLEPHSIWYPRTSGIWQTVWLEKVPHTWLRRLAWTANVERWEIAVDANVEGRHADGARVRVRLTVGTRVLADDTYLAVAGEVARTIRLPDPGIDDARDELMWTPAVPVLVQAEVTVLAPDGAVVDAVRSYTAMRSVAIERNTFVLNGRPCPLRLVLDQGYWPETGLTAPDDAALRRDVELVKAMGFNGVRKHQKIEDPRFLYWADRLGLLVWGEMPSCYRFSRDAIARLTQEWVAAIERDRSHPCIVAWVPFNESWGVPNLPQNAPEREYVRGVYHLTHALDPSRPVVGNDGWESVATDIVCIHDYDPVAEHHTRRYDVVDAASRAQMLERERPGRRRLVLDGDQAAQPFVLSEFGGITYAQDRDRTWGYSTCGSPEELERRYAALLAGVHAARGLAGFCYTQLTDTYQEANGLLYMDRTPKFPLAAIRAATRGPLTFFDEMSDKTDAALRASLAADDDS